MIQKFLLFSLFFLVIFLSPQVFAVPVSEIFFTREPALLDRIYGISGGIELLPQNTSIDEPIQFTLSMDEVKLDHKENYFGHIALFREEGFNHIYIPSVYDADNKITSAFVNKTGFYVFAPIVPKENFELHLSKKDLMVDEEFTVTSGPIISTSGEPIWDGFPFVIGGSNFEVIGLPFDSKREEYSIKAKDGKVQFNAKIHLPTTGIVVTYIEVTSRDFGNLVGVGKVNVENVKEATNFVNPPRNLRVKNHTLVWRKSIDQDIYRYSIDYRVKGEEEWSMLTQVGGVKNQYKIKISYALPFEFRVTAVDLSLNVSEPTNIVEYTPPFTPVPYPSPFSDIQNHWAKEYIDELESRGLITGYPDGTFQPDQPINRVELLTVALKTFGQAEDITVNEKPFKDIAMEQWYSPFVSQAKKLKFITGYADDTFRPDKNVNRAEGLKILLNVAGELNVSNENAKPIRYADVPQSSWFASYVTEATQKSIIQGFQGSQQDAFFLLKPLWLWMSGNEVHKLQQALHILGHYREPVTGIYDEATMQAVYDFQVAEGIVKTPFNPLTNGTFGENTRKALNAKMALMNQNFFKPDGLLSRAEVSKIMVKILELRK